MKKISPITITAVCTSQEPIYFILYVDLFIRNNTQTPHITSEQKQKHNGDIRMQVQRTIFFSPFYQKHKNCVNDVFTRLRARQRKKAEKNQVERNYHWRITKSTFLSQLQQIFFILRTDSTVHASILETMNFNRPTVPPYGVVECRRFIVCGVHFST